MSERGEYRKIVTRGAARAVGALGFSAAVLLPGCGNDNTPKAAVPSTASTVGARTPEPTAILTAKENEAQEIEESRLFIRNQIGELWGDSVVVRSTKDEVLELFDRCKPISSDIKGEEYIEARKQVLEDCRSLVNTTMDAYVDTGNVGFVIVSGNLFVNVLDPIGKEIQYSNEPPLPDVFGEPRARFENIDQELTNK